VRPRFIEIGLSETSNLAAQFAKPEPGKEQGEGMAVFRFLFERELRTGNQANCYARLSDCGESARDRTAKFCRY
jgi:hypothetical protein